MTQFLPTALLVAALSCLAPVAMAQQKAAEIPVETFFKRQDTTGMGLSPNGELLAALSNVNGRANLMVIDIAKRTKKIITSFSQYDVATFTWINNRRLYFRVIETRDVLQNSRYIGTYAVDVDGENLRNLTDLVGGKLPRGSTIVADIAPVMRTNDDSDDMIVQMNFPRYEAADIHRMDTKTARSKQRLTVDAPATSA